MTKFSNKFKKPCFWPIFPIFGAKRFFLKNRALSRPTRHVPLTQCWVSEKTNEPIPWKLTNRWKDGRVDGTTDGRIDRQTLFYRTLPATARGPIKALQSLRYINPVFSLLLIKNWYLASYGSLAYKYILSISGWLFIKFNKAFLFPDPEPLIISILYGWSAIMWPL